MSIFIYDDSEARSDGAGVFVLRSTDITCQSNVEALTDDGFKGLTGDMNSTENHKVRTSHPLQFAYPEGTREPAVSAAAVQYSDAEWFHWDGNSFGYLLSTFDLAWGVRGVSIGKAGDRSRLRWMAFASNCRVALWPDV